MENFETALTLSVICYLSNEDTLQFFLHCLHYIDIRKLLFSDMSAIDESMIHLSETKLFQVLLNGKPNFNLIKKAAY